MLEDKTMSDKNLELIRLGVICFCALGVYAIRALSFAIILAAKTRQYSPEDHKKALNGAIWSHQDMMEVFLKEDTKFGETNLYGKLGDFLVAAGHPKEEKKDK